MSGPSLKAASADFLTDKLEFDRSFLDDVGDFHVERVVDPRSKVEQEVVIELPNPSIRDAIKARGFKLQGKRAGIRIELPHYLKSDFNLLQSISYKMKMANPEMKRSVKFDDELLGLYLDVQIPGQDWRRIRPSQARAARDADPSIRSGPLELSSNMISEAMRPSTSSAATSSPGPNSSRPLALSQPPLTGANADPIL